MARSVGEAIATGLESGIGLSMRMDQNKRAIAADARAEERMKQVQAREDAAAGRQQAGDKLGALKTQLGMIGAEAQAATDGGYELPPARQMAIGAATKEIDAQINRAYADLGGADIEAITKKYDDAIEGMKTGKFDPSTLSGPEFGAILTQATGMTPKAFMRGPAGEPSEIEQASAAVQKGIEGGDQQSLLAGLNVLLKPNIDKIVGKPSAHGGTIVGAELAGLYDDPNAPKDDPRLVPMLKVYVDDPEQQGPRQNGAIGWYMAPVTEGRETGGNAKVKSISTTKGMDWLGKNLELVEALNTPEAAAKVQEAYATPGMTPEDWQAVKARLGVKARKKTTDSFTLKPDEVRVERDIGPDGRPIAGSERRTEGKPRTATAARQGSTQQTIDAIDALVEDGTLTEEEGKARKRALAARVSTGTKAQGLSGGGGGKGGGGKGAPALSKEERADIKEESDALDKKEQRIISLANLSKPKEPKAPDVFAEDAAKADFQRKQAKYESDVAAHEKKLADALEKINKEQDDLSARRQRRAEERAPGPAPAAAGKPVVTKSKADYDALPKGALYVKDGQTYRKN